MPETNAPTTHVVVSLPHGAGDAMTRSLWDEVRSLRRLNADLAAENWRLAQRVEELEGELRGREEACDQS